MNSLQDKIGATQNQRMISDVETHGRASLDLGHL